jgi:hypothetical protein
VYLLTKQETVQENKKQSRQNKEREYTERALVLANSLELYREKKKLNQETKERILMTDTADQNNWQCTVTYC